MKAITVEPLKPGTAILENIPEPAVHDGSVLVEAVAVGVCGTDVEIVGGRYGWAPPGKARLVLGHESLGRVVDADHTREIDARVLDQRTLDLERTDVGTVVHDDLLLASEEPQVVLVVDANEIAGIEPTVAQDLRSGVGVLPVADRAAR